MNLHLRDATLDDLEDLTRIAIAVIPQEAVVRYLYPKMDEYPDDVYKYTRLEMEQFIQDKIDKWKYKVMLCEKQNLNRKPHMETIAFSVWEISALKIGEHLPGSEGEGSVEEKDDDSERRDADQVRIKYYQRIVNEARRTYLEPSGRENGPLSYLHCTRLATDPRWQRHGAGTLLSKWGLDVANDQTLAIGLFATPSGESLYTELGFELLTRITVQMPEEEESVTIACMKCEPKI
ncbi:hypothetical protein V8E51_017544 [Hyaloscypha variabilis]